MDTILKIFETILEIMDLYPVIIYTVLIIILIFILICLIAFFQGREIAFWPPKIGPKPTGIRIEASEIPLPKEEEHQESILYLGGYTRSEHPKFLAEVERLVPTATEITLIATGLNLIWQKRILDMLIERAQSGDAKVTICLGNPYSPHVEDRLIEEEMQGRRPPVGRVGIELNARALVERLEKAGNPPNISILLFEHYPTFATLLFDQEIYIYPYGYQILGNASPIFHFQNDDSEEARFFVANAEAIVRDAVPARDVVYRSVDPKYYSDKWVAAAVYLIPDENEPFYQFGSSILGYDVRGKRTIDIGGNDIIKSVRPHIGDAAQYGFHATIADALFYVNQAEIDRIEAEVRMLSKEFPPFDLTNFRIVERANEGDIVVLCEDETGITEALHCELISRVYRTAISSPYLTGRTKRKVGSKYPLRSNLFVGRYGVPYILKEFNLHFSLCSPAPDNPRLRGEIVEILQKFFINEVNADRIHFNKLYLLIKRHGDEVWTISSDHTLCGKLG